MLSIKCSNKIHEHNYLTIGHIYFINKTIRTREIEDKDFFYRIMTGKSYIDLFDNPDQVLYTPTDTVGIDRADFMQPINKQNNKNNKKQNKKQTIAKSNIIATKQEDTNEEDNIRCSYTNVVREIVTTVSNTEYENLKNLVQKVNNTDEIDMKEVPSFIRSKMQHLEKAPANTTHRYFSYIEIIDILQSFIETGVIDKRLPKKSQHKILNDIKIIIAYLIVAYEKNNKKDFPKVDDSSRAMNKGLNNTIMLPQDHFLKWTVERVKAVQNTEDEYHKIVLFDPILREWKKTKVEHVDLEDLTHTEIRTMHLIKELLLKNTIRCDTDSAIFVFADKNTENRFIKVIQAIRDIMKQHISQYAVKNFSYFIFDGLSQNQYIAYEENNDKEKIIIEISKKMKNFFQAPTQELIAVGVEHKLIEKRNILL